MEKTLLKEHSAVKDIFDKSISESQIILVDLEKVERILNSLNSDSFRKDLYPYILINSEENFYTEKSKIVKESHLKKLISIFGEKKFTLSHNSIHNVLPYLFENNTYNNKNKVKDKLIKLFSFARSSAFSLGDFTVNPFYEKNKFFGWLTKEEVEENFMKILEELTDIHERFTLEKKGELSPELTVNIMEYLCPGNKLKNYKEIASQCEEMIRILFYSLRRAHEFKLDIVAMENEIL
ncbi:MAG TPA: hypothetical protein PL110_00575 [Candidatus Eremiobacteraeota bacterium]|nr:MAG: hypothetical protein BWY64_00119 [bacterium ADurb.Bin363]HPZ06581.1 hypothetical protein [Candidatus Eremiobacteraeota bacterium]